MARVTVEDCILKVSNRFQLVLLAAQRTRSISAGAALTVDRDNDRNPVVALREIAGESINLVDLENSLVKDQQKHVELDEPEEDEVDLIAIQQEMSGELDEAVSKVVIDEDLMSEEEDDDEGEDKAATAEEQESDDEGAEAQESDDKGAAAQEPDDEGAEAQESEKDVGS